MEKHSVLLLITTIIFCPGTTKKIKLKHLEEPSKDILAIYNDSTRYYVDTIGFKVFGKVEHRGTILGYDPVNKLYHIIYDDDAEEFNDNEV